MPYNEEQSLEALKALLKTVNRLRAPGGCPWDREQTHHSLRKYLVEETYETIDVLDQIDEPAKLKEPKIKQAYVDEWGDVLLQVLLNAEISSETEKDTSIEQIARHLNEKMIRRHPHVFGEVKVSSSANVVQNWDEIKKKEKGSDAAPESVFTGIPRGLAPLLKTMKIISKVTKVGFQWPDLQGPTEKLDEEVKELKAALTHSDLPPEEFINKIQSEIGDVLFSVCNIAYFMKIDPEVALRDTLRKFESRFRFVEDRLREQGKKPETVTLDEMDKHWNAAKRVERGERST